MSAPSSDTERKAPALAVADLLLELEQEAQATRRVLERVPEDRLDWTPHPKSMTLGQLAMHIANLPGAIAEVSRAWFDVNTVIPRPTATSSGELLQALEESLARARSILSPLDDAHLLAPWQMMKGEEVIFAITRGELLRSVMLNHWYHHRGQLTVYLRLLDVPLPAIYGDSADERVFSG
ncbi:MAG TPA: DinB family protein [Gemmatimonadales bacterium]|nr:DinB family protein [Gemmatimonadales bacterium]